MERALWRAGNGLDVPLAPAAQCHFAAMLAWTGPGSTGTSWRSRTQLAMASHSRRRFEQSGVLCQDHIAIYGQAAFLCDPRERAWLRAWAGRVHQTDNAARAAHLAALKPAEMVEAGHPQSMPVWRSEPAPERGSGDRAAANAAARPVFRNTSAPRQPGRAGLE